MAFQGVNLGGWLVLEKWITPGVFEGTSAIDEYSLCLELGEQGAKERLEKHRQTFITREHIKKLSGMGLKTLRLPVGYWLFEAPTPFVGGGDTHVDQLFDWAQEFEMQVILDIHGAPGSQNGWDHSGRAGEIGWPSEQNIQTSLRFLERLTVRYGQSPVLFGIEVLNEPHWDIPLDTLIDYYQRSHRIIDQACRAEIRVICSDAFRLEQMAERLAGTRLSRIVLDVHMYQLFTPEDRALGLDGHLEKAVTNWPDLLRGLSKYVPVMVGEWSAAMDGSYNNDEYAQYFQAQRKTFDGASIGWTYWTARTQDGGAWSLLDHPEFLEK